MTPNQKTTLTHLTALFRERSTLEPVFTVLTDTRAPGVLILPCPALLDDQNSGIPLDDITTPTVKQQQAVMVILEEYDRLLKKYNSEGGP